MAVEKKILLVDDNLFVLGAMALAFKREGFVVEKAGSAGEAFNFLKNSQPDIILSDYEMPDMNGFAFRKALLQNNATKNIPFVFLTAHSDSSLIMEGLDGLQAVDFIDKSTPLPVIISKLDNLIDTFRQKQASYLEELRKAAEALNVKSAPSKKPVIGGFDIDFWHKPYQGYPGGDFIDFISAGPSKLFIALGDVMGKKWTAWYFMFGYLSYIRAAVRFCISSGEFAPAVILKNINQAVCQDEALADVLATLSLLLVDGETGQVSYAGAGDLPLLWYKAAEGTVCQVKTSGLLLGLFGDGGYDSQNITMDAGDRLLVFSDGVIDYTENDQKKSDYELFKNNMRQVLITDNSFGAISNYLKEQLDGGRQADDCSLISLCKK